MGRGPLPQDAARGMLSIPTMIRRSVPWKPSDSDLAPGYAALSAIPRRRRRGHGTLWLATSAVLAVSLAAFLMR